MLNPSPLPDGAALLALEDHVRRSGSGLEAERLCGCWRLEQVWSKGAVNPSAFSGALLRSLGAQLEIQPAANAAPGLELRNAVGWGPSSSASMAPVGCRGGVRCCCSASSAWSCGWVGCCC